MAVFTKDQTLVYHDTADPTFSAKIGSLFINDSTGHLFNNIDGSTGWRRYYPSSGTWANRPLTGNVDGDYYTVTGGATYIWSSAIGEWVRPWVYAGTPILDGGFTGAVTPDQVGWTNSLTGDGAITSDGTKVTLQSTSTGRAQVTLAHEITTGTHFIMGLFASTTHSGALGANRMLIVSDKARYLIVSLAHAASNGYVRNIDLSSNVIGFSPTDTSATSEVLIEVFVHGTVVETYVDNSQYPNVSALRSSFTASTSGYYGIGDTSGGSSTEVFTARQVFVGRY